MSAPKVGIFTTSLRSTLPYRVAYARSSPHCIYNTILEPMVRGWLLLVFGVVMAGSAIAQNTPVNLVPNGGFEEHSDCPTNPGGLGDCDHWWPLHGSPDYFHGCSTGDFDVPLNVYGVQNAIDSAYVGVATYTPQFSGGQESVFLELTEPLQSGVKYRVSFKVSLADSINYSTCCMGAILSNVAPPLPPFNTNLSDVELEMDASTLSDQLWYELNAVYTALGGEDKLFIGSFRPDTDSNPYYRGQIREGADAAYFYIDDVSVIEDTVTGIGEVEKDGTEVSVYPNPCTNVLNIRLQDSSPPQADGMTIEVTDMLGRTISSPPREEGSGEVIQLDTSPWPSGIYLLHATNAQGLRSVVKVVKE
ncbi:MAG: T9SS type A sorting domain-containing protein [Flavobacteriales bacterium]|nr:T9SS type A sorting domain-containing protein [Flavobacteriales bacterium]